MNRSQAEKQKEKQRQEGLQRHLPQLVMCGDFTIRGGWQLGPRTNDDFEIVYFPAGSKSLYIEGEHRQQLHDPCLVFTPPHIEHAYHFASDKPIRHLFVHFTWQDSGQIRPYLPAVTLLAAAPQLDPFIRHLLVLAGTMPAGWTERVSALLFSLLLELKGTSCPADDPAQTMPARPAYAMTKQPPPVPEALRELPLQIVKALQHIEEHLQLPQLNIKALAEQAGWTHEYFSRSFVKGLGIPPRRYLLERRVARACELLRYQTSSVKEIAYLAGFQSEQYFCRAFGAIMGISPTKYRERHMDRRMQHLYLAPPTDRIAAYPLNRYFIAP